MRSLRLIVLALGASTAVGLTPAVSSAQHAAPRWQDSWYWGAYGGYAMLATAPTSTSAPTVGADWVITRSRYALTLFAEQSFFNAVSTVPFSGFPEFGTMAPTAAELGAVAAVYS